MFCDFGWFIYLLHMVCKIGRGCEVGIPDKLSRISCRITGRKQFIRVAFFSSTATLGSFDLLTCSLE